MAAKNSSKLSRVRGRARSIRKGTKKGTKTTEVVYHSTKEIRVERALIENFIGLQRVMVGLSARFDSLSSQISKLLDLFEISAKSLARKEASSPENLDAKKVMEKLDRLSSQAGLIGRGLALIHEIGTEEGKPVIPLNVQNRPQPAPSMSFPSPSARNIAKEPAQKMTKEVPERPMVRETKTSAPGENAS